MGGNYLLWLLVQHLLWLPARLEPFPFHHHDSFKRFSEPQHASLPKCLPAMITKPGLYHLSLTSDDLPCKSFLLAPPDHVIQFSILKSTVDCETGFVDLFDGMKTTRESFPNEASEWEEFCDVTELPFTALRTRANVGMVGYYVGREGESMDLAVEFVPNETPCDMVVVDDEGSMDLESSGNCTVLLLNSKVIEVTEMNIGRKKRRYFRQPVVSAQCINMRDNLEILGGSDIGEDYMELFSRLCGLSTGGLGTINRGAVVPVPCPYTMVKLTSSGVSSNKARIHWRTNEGDYDEKCLFPRTSS